MQTADNLFNPTAAKADASHINFFDADTPAALSGEQETAVLPPMDGPANDGVSTEPPEAGEAGEGEEGGASSPSSYSVGVCDQLEAGEGGKPGEDAAFTGITAFTPTNREFLAAIFDTLPEGARPLVAGKHGDPQDRAGGWPAFDAGEVGKVCPPDRNTYFNCASFVPDDEGNPSARKEHAAAYHVLVLDDVGTKVDSVLLGDIEPTWRLETSPGNFQVGFKLSVPLRDAREVDEFQQKIAKAGLTDRGALGMSRWVRLPNGINGKPKYEQGGVPFRCQLQAWNQHVVYSASDLLDAWGQAAPGGESGEARQPLLARPTGTHANEDAIHVSRSKENPVLAAFKEHGLYKRELSPGKHDVTCPWVHEHTDELDGGAAYFEPGTEHPNGGFCCQHSHKDQFRLGKVLDHFGLTQTQARNRGRIRIVPGEMHTVVDAAEWELAQQENVFHAGGLIVKAAHDPVTGDWGLKPIPEADVTLMLSRACDWEKQDGKAKSWVRCDPSFRHVTTLFKAERYRHLQPVTGLARQPYYREADGLLITAPGYDVGSHRLGVFDGLKFPPVGRTKADALVALDCLKELLSEFRFETEADQAAALAAILTAAVRPSLDLAPAIHVKAPAPGTGKSYLCEVISLFAGPGTPARMSYPKSSDEATKAIMAGLLGAPAVMEFDDMDSDMQPWGSINRMLTSRSITDRILGHSKTATVSTNTLVLSSGNNVGPVRDLCRRVLTINLNAREETPGTLSYRGNPVATVRADRERHVMMALTIGQAWKEAGCPRADVPSLASYGGAWADHCRHPLIWLGEPDPAANLIEQMRSDPDATLTKALLAAWHRQHGSAVLPVRKLLSNVSGDMDEALSELPVFDHGKVNNSKLGWYLKRNMNRIFGGYMLERVCSAERTSWKVVKVDSGEPASPPLPPSLSPALGSGPIF